jgi:hypothetical protein
MGDAGRHTAWFMPWVSQIHPVAHPITGTHEGNSC